MCDCDPVAELQKTVTIYVLGCFVILLTLLVAFLLYKIKTFKYQVMKDESILPAGEQTKINVTKQDSLEPKESLEVNFNSLKRNAEQAKTLLIVDETDGVQKPTITKTVTHAGPQINILELKSHLMKTRHGMIQRDEIHKICENELTKTQPTNTSLQDLKNTPFEWPKLKKSVSQIEKTDSTNQLINEDALIYDNVPRTPRTDDDANKNLKSVLFDTSNIRNASVFEKTASMPQLLEIDDFYDELPCSKPIVEEVYDIIPCSKNIVVSDQDTDYLCLISEESNVEPCYSNANLKS